MCGVDLGLHTSHTGAGRWLSQLWGYPVRGIQHLEGVTGNSHRRPWLHISQKSLVFEKRFWLPMKAEVQRKSLTSLICKTSLKEGWFLHLEWISNEVLLYRTGNYAQSLGIDHDGNFRDTYIYMYVYIYVYIYLLYLILYIYIYFISYYIYIIYMYDWVTLLYSRSWHNIVN